MKFHFNPSPRAPNIIEQKNPDFKDLHGTVDSVFRSLRTEGVGTEVKHAPVVTKEQENLLWEHIVVDLSTPLGLLWAIFYSNGKNICLRGVKEHRKLKVTQFTRYSNPDRFIYADNGSKNRTGGFVDLKIENKIVPIIVAL